MLTYYAHHFAEADSHLFAISAISVLFCSVLQPSSIRGLVTPWTYFLHLSLSSCHSDWLFHGESCVQLYLPLSSIMLRYRPSVRIVGATRRQAQILGAMAPKYAPNPRRIVTERNLLENGDRSGTLRSWGIADLTANVAANYAHIKTIFMHLAAYRRQGDGVPLPPPPVHQRIRTTFSFQNPSTNFE